MPDSIMGLANKILVNPIKVAVTPVSSTAEKVTQWVLFVERGNKRALLKEVLRDPAMTRVLVFTRTKHGANRVAEELDKKGVPSAAIHGNKSQSARQRALDAFKAGRVRVLVATDIAARGIDVDGVTHVINFEIPDEPESYVHRIGRTARAGASGVALSFCDAEERGSWRDIERLIRAQVPVVADHPGRPDVEDRGARLDHVGGDETRHTGRGDHDVGASHVRGQILRACVAQRHSRVLGATRQQQPNRPADRDAAPDDDNLGSVDLDAIPAQQFNAASRCAWLRSRLHQHKAAQIARVQPVRVLARVHQLEHRELVETSRQRQLHDVAGAPRVGVEFADDGFDVGL